MPTPATPAPTTPDRRAVCRAVHAVPDPELPPVTIGMLGMVADVLVADDGHVEVELLPTFSGCPATDLIARDVVTSVREVAGVTGVDVRFTFDPPWTPDRIDATGRARLREFGITPPGGPVHRAVAPAGRTTLPLAVGPTTSPTASGAATDGAATDGAAGDGAATDGAAGDGAAGPAACPYCGSTATTRDSPFGPTPCRDLWHCSACQQPFEAFKPA